MPKHVWAIRVRLAIAENHRDLALFNLAIDSELRGCNLVNPKVAGVYAHVHVKLDSILRYLGVEPENAPMISESVES